MKRIESFTASIYVGLRENYTPEVRSIQMAREWLQAHVNKTGLCVTLTPTEFIYTNGNEPGFCIGLINYPRFPLVPRDLRDKAIYIASEMLQIFKQGKVSVVFSDETVMLEGEGFATDPAL